MKYLENSQLEQVLLGAPARAARDVSAAAPATPAKHRSRWNDLEDGYLIANWTGRSDALNIAHALGRTAWGVIARATHLELPSLRRSRGLRREPSKAEWVRIATEEAVQATLDPVALLAGCLRSGYPAARWRAWRRAKDLSPRYSVAGVGRVSGFDHTAVRFGLMRLAGIPREVIWGKATRCS